MGGDVLRDWRGAGSYLMFILFIFLGDVSWEEYEVGIGCIGLL